MLSSPSTPPLPSSASGSGNADHSPSFSAQIGLGREPSARCVTVSPTVEFVNLRRPSARVHSPGSSTLGSAAICRRDALHEPVHREMDCLAPVPLAITYSFQFLI